MTDPAPRNFTDRQRQALFILADGKCRICGEALGDGWEADHITPWSKGGQTELTNGQALCQKCNRKKGDKMIEYRSWQARFFDGYTAKNLKDFLLVATPGGGKTFAALEIAKRQLDSGEAQKVIIITPTEPLKRQWAKEAARFSIQLDPNWAGTKIKDGFDGIVITYSAVINSKLFLEFFCQRWKVLVIFDEIHHASEDRAWGESSKIAFEYAQRRLCLSGTPFRSDGNKIPFITYQNDESVADFTYSYGNAIVDDVCRSIAFPSFDGDISWWDTRKGELIESSSFDEVLSEPEEAQRLRVALDPSQPFVTSMLTEAINKLNELRQDDPKAAGLVVAIDTDHANSIAKLLEKLTGDPPTVVHSNIPESANLIEQFDRGNRKWIVSVRMVSEGIDIRRLRVGVYATVVTSELLFRQIIGRVIRRMSDNDDWAFFYVPKDRRLTGFMEKIKEERKHVIDKKYHDDIERLGALTGNGTRPGFEVYPVSAVHNPDGDITIADGEAYERNFIEFALKKCAEYGIKANDAQAAMLVKDLLNQKAGIPRLVSTVEAKPDYLKVEDIRKVVHKKAYSVACEIKEKYTTQKSQQEITAMLHAEWSRKPGRNRQKEAGLEELKDKLLWLDTQLDEPWKYIR